MNTANRIKRLRLQAGWTQTELARRLNTTRQSVSRYEKGDKPNRAAIARMARLFGVSEAFLEHGEAGQSLSPSVKSLLGDVIATLRGICERENIDLPHDKYAAVIVSSLSHAVETGAVSEDRMRELIDLAR